MPSHVSKSNRLSLMTTPSCVCGNAHMSEADDARVQQLLKKWQGGWSFDIIGLHAYGCMPTGAFCYLPFEFDMAKIFGMAKMCVKPKKGISHL